MCLICEGLALSNTGVHVAGDSGFLGKLLQEVFHVALLVLFSGLIPLVGPDASGDHGVSEHLVLVHVEVCVTFPTEALGAGELDIA